MMDVPDGEEAIVRLAELPLEDVGKIAAVTVDGVQLTRDK